ncbi:hypothetical protein F4810DRAFT_551083 [Camillea tinctor]|nr:hypothetical protein F4810DRAFT_551083 [Camillea tinctor]
MPSSTTTWKFSCGHTLTMRGQALDDNCPKSREDMTLSRRCLSCLCSSVLEALVDGLDAVSRSYINELAYHCESIKKHPWAASYLTEELVAEVLKPSDVVSFRRAIVALAGFHELMGGDITPCSID